ncbi:MAG: head-tail connector protein [Fimbriiglobus sp.]
MPISILTPATLLPLTVAEVESQAKLPTGLIPAQEINSLIRSAVDLFERTTGLFLLTTAVRQHLTSWQLRTVKLTRLPVQSVTTWHYLDTSSNPQVLAGWRLEKSDSRAVLSIPTGVYPAIDTKAEFGSWVDFFAGWQTVEAVPDAIKTALRLLCAHWLRHGVSHTEANLKDLPEGWGGICDMYTTGNGVGF